MPTGDYSNPEASEVDEILLIQLIDTWTDMKGIIENCRMGICGTALLDGMCLVSGPRRVWLAACARA